MLGERSKNHPAATFRGLKGQLTSGYPGHGGVDKGKGWTEKDNARRYSRRSYATLPSLLSSRGYRTVFLSPHPQRDALHSLLQMLDFEEIYTREKAVDELLNGHQPFNRGSLTDHDLFQALGRYLEANPRDARRPLFLALYNIGTHAFLDVDPSGVRYGDGKNPVLNTTHNFDAELGRFLDRFFNSPRARDTLLILTSDHAHYPEPPYVEVIADEDYRPYFIDRIPLIIHAPAMELPERFDAQGRTSVDFAPTILHLLGIDDAPQAFLGTSIFSRRFPSAEVSIAAIGSAGYAIHGDTVHAAAEIPPEARAAFDQCWSVVRSYHAAEQQGRVYPSAASNSGNTLNKSPTNP